MTTPESPEQTSTEHHAADALPPQQAPHSPAAPSIEAPAPAAVAHHASDASAHDDGPQPGNEAHDADASEGDDDGPAPGNEKDPSAQAAPGDGTKRKRRRRRKRGAHAGEGAAGAPGAPVEGDAAVEGAGTDKPALQSHHAHGAHGPNDRKKRDHGPRPDRERPAFTVGDVTFGKILEITDDAIFVDLFGKAKALFDIRELLLPADYDNEPVEEPTEADEGGHTPAEDGHEADADAQHADGEVPTDATTPAEATKSNPVEASAATEPSASTPVAAAPSTEATPSTDVAPAAANASANASANESGDAPVEAPPEAAAAEGEPRPADPPLPTVVLEVGAQFVGVVHNDGGRGGMVVLTHHPKRISRAKVSAAKALKDHSLVWGLVTGVIKGGADIDLEGLRAFAPASHMTHYLGGDLTHLVGKRLDFYVTQYKKRGRDVVVSRKPLLEAEAKKAREEALAKIEIGAVVEGTVRSVVTFGAFVDIGGIEGLVPLPEMSHNRADRPNDVFKAGEKVAVKIMKLDERGKVWLSRKAAVADPWGEVAKKYAVGTKHTGKVVRIQPFGAFVELENGIDGLIHFPDLVLFGPNGVTGMKKAEDINELVKIGDSLDVVVAHVESGAHRIGLHPALSGEYAEETPQKITVGKMVKAVVYAAEPGGVLVRIIGATGRLARGYVSGAGTGTQRGTDLRKLFPAKMAIEAKVLEIDPKRAEIKLSIKALNDETERHAFQQYRAQVKTAARFTLGDILNKKK